jgi:pyruvate,water dikinase
LDDNSRALGIIADLGEKMSCSYLFDIAYVRKAYADLAARMKVSLGDFNQLTGGKYPELEHAFGSMDTHIRTLISEGAQPRERLLFFFDEVTQEMAREVGGKNFPLCELRNNLGLETPEVFVLTVLAFEEFVKHNHFGDIISALESQDIDSGRLRELRRLILEGSFPPSLQEAIDATLRRLRSHCGNDCFVVVRSSAEEEDGIFFCWIV